MADSLSSIKQEESEAVRCKGEENSTTPKHDFPHFSFYSQREDAENPNRYISVEVCAWFTFFTRTKKGGSAVKILSVESGAMFQMTFLCLKIRGIVS